jgi:MFS transporter, UMF1 family
VKFDVTKKELSWAMYDWANSAYFTTVVAGFFPVFLNTYWSDTDHAGLTTQRLGVTLLIMNLLLAVVSPFLGTISDFRASKKKFIFVFMLVGTLSTSGLFFLEKGAWFPAILLYAVATFCCSGSAVFYDSMLVSVTSPNRFNKISSFGYALGYLGGGVLFAVNLVMVLKPEIFGLQYNHEAVRYSFLTVAVWWFIFSMPLLFNVNEPDAKQSSESLPVLFAHANRELKKIFFEIYSQKNIFWFLVAYWFYIDGLGTVISMAVNYGMELKFNSSVLMVALLLVQFVGFPSSIFMGKLADRIGNKRAIMTCLSIYVVVILGAPQMTESKHFYILAGMIGLAQGGAQALSRSLFALLIPREKSGEYFGFFNLLGKFASVMGPGLMAAFAYLIKEPRYSILSLLILFGLGMLFLTKVKMPVPTQAKI